MNECIQKGTELVQAIANELFFLLSTEAKDGLLVELPPPKTRLPREKHVSPLIFNIFVDLLIVTFKLWMFTFLVDVTIFLLSSFQSLSLLQNGNFLLKKKVGHFCSGFICFCAVLFCIEIFIFPTI